MNINNKNLPISLLWVSSSAMESRGSYSLSISQVRPASTTVPGCGLTCQMPGGTSLAVDLVHRVPCRGEQAAACWPPAACLGVAFGAEANRLQLVGSVPGRVPGFLCCCLHGLMAKVADLFGVANVGCGLQTRY